MAFVGTKLIGQTEMQFHPNGSVTVVKPSDPSLPKEPSDPSPSREISDEVIDQVKGKVQEVVEAVQDAVKPKARRGRKPKASAE